MKQRTSRRFPRIPADAVAFVKILGDRRRDRIAWVKVLSAGGCMLVSEESIGYLSLMEMKISLGERELLVDGRVAWEDCQRPGEHRVGVEFLRVGRADRSVIDSLVASSGAAA